MPGQDTRKATSRNARAAAGASPAGLARGVLALSLLLALVAGIPIALLAVGSAAHLAVLTDLPRLTAELTGPDDGSLFLAVLTVLAWIGWATFALAVVLEIPAQ